jgi:[NiFe] hydrogenase diaphorase moiety large subunit
MLATEREKLKEEIRALGERFGRERSALLPLLQEIQRKHRRISDYAMQELADMLGIHPVEVYGVVSFYAFLGDQPRGRYVVRLCRTISCDMTAKNRVARQLESDLGIKFGETTPDGKFTLEWANCLGMCDQGPAMLVNERVFTKVTPNKVHEILEECRKAFGVYAVEHREEHLA